MAEKFSVDIDAMQLDKEWQGQARRYKEVAEQLADQRAKTDAAKAELELTTAELRLAIRTDPEAYGLAKVTEAALEDMVKLQPRYKRAVQTLADAKHEQDVVAALVEAMQHRKYALQELVALHLAGYFAAPQAKPADRDDVKAAQRKLVRGRTAQAER